MECAVNVDSVDVPVQMLFQHLVDADAEGFIVEALWNEVFVNPELRSSHRFALWNLGQVESEFSVMAPHWQKLLIVFNCTQKKTAQEMHPFYISASKTVSECFRRAERLA